MVAIKTILPAVKATPLTLRRLLREADILRATHGDGVPRAFRIRYQDAQGQFAGAVTAAVPLSYFQQALQTLDVGAKGYVELRDGLLGAQFELNRKSAIFALTFNDALDERVLRELGPRAATMLAPAGWW